MTRHGLATILAALLVTGLVWIQVADLATPDAITPVPSPACRSHSIADQRPEPTSEPSLVRTERIPVATGSLETSAETRLDGTFTVTDPHGTVYPHEDGWFEYWLPAECQRPWHSVTEIRKGQWTIPGTPRPHAIRIGTVVLGGRPTLFAAHTERDTYGEIAVPRSGSTALSALWLPDVRLRVVDSGTGIDLTGITVERLRYEDEAPDWLANWDEPPHRSHVLQDGVSPLRFAPPDNLASRMIRLRVRAPDHAWGRVTIHVDDPAERFVPLQPGGDLRVTVGGELPGLAAVRIRSPRLPDWPGDVAPWRNGSTCVFDGLPAGPYTVTLQGKADEPAHVYGRTRLVLEPGERNHAIIPVTNPRPGRPDFVPVAGTIELPVEWSWDCDPSITLRARGDASELLYLAEESSVQDLTLSSSTADPPGTWRWHCRTLPPGDYQLRVERFEFLTTVTVPPGGDESIQIRVPRPGRVVVRTIDAATSQPIEGFPTWSPVVEPRDDPEHDGYPRRNSKGTYTFYAAPGRIRITPTHRDFSWQPTEVRVVDDGDHEVVLPLTRCCRARVVLLDGTTELPWARHWRALLTRDGQEVPLRHGPDGAIATIEPCRGDLTVTGISGYHSPKPTPVTMQRGVEPTISVRLRRR